MLHGAMEFDTTSSRTFLALPEGYALPDVEDLLHDARAILLHTLNVRTGTQAQGSEIQVSPIWENQDGQAAVRAAVVPKEVEQRHFEGKGMAALRHPDALTMIGDVVEIFAEEPVAAARALSMTGSLWVRDDLPLKTLEMPYKGHYKLLTLVIADFLRKIGAGFDELEWITSLGILSAYHDPDKDPPVEEIQASTREKMQRLIVDENAWLMLLANSAQVQH